MIARNPIWIKEEEVLAIHDELIVEHGGGSGIRDSGLLKSALERPKHKFYYEKASIFILAATYADSITNNHPFIDGNKRTAFVIAILFLELNGFDFKANEENAFHMTMGLASGEISLLIYAQWLKDYSCPSL
jgi:death-on-curing protein